MRYCGRACLLALVLMIATGCSKPGPSQRGRPNILFIYTDDQSWRTVASYSGRTWVRTPNLDRLSSEGMRFTFAYAASWCAPSRATAMTGLLPHGIRGLHFSNDVDATYDPDLFRLWPAELRKAGYRTVMIGKWHLGPARGQLRNWDHSVIWDQRDVPDLPERRTWYYDQPLSIDGAPKRRIPGYSTDLYTQFALEEIRRQHDRPWFLWLCYNAPHLPNIVPPRHQKRYENVDL